MNLPKYQTAKSLPRLPPWLKKPFRSSDAVHQMKKRLRGRHLNTVCEEARCPNLGECWERKTATMMILGGVCTRHCGFCSVTTGKPLPIDPDEPKKVAEMVEQLGLKHVVITCVARDDLEDGGAGQFVSVIGEIRNSMGVLQYAPAIEILTTDFQLKKEPMESICDAKPDIFNHNIETVRHLTPQVRHRATYDNSLEFLRSIKEYDSSIQTKSGLMVGLGETKEEVIQAMEDLRSVGCEMITIGQYLQPTSNNLPVVEYLTPEYFEEVEKIGYNLGFRSVASGPFVRSSYLAGKIKLTI